MIVQYFLDNLLPVLMLLGGGIGWIFDRRSQKASYERMLIENKGADVSTIETMRQTLKSISEDVSARISEMKDDVLSLRSENECLEKKVKDLEGELKVARDERNSFTVEIEHFRAQSIADGALISQLKAKIDKYEKEIKLYRKELKQ